MAEHSGAGYRSARPWQQVFSGHFFEDFRELSDCYWLSLSNLFSPSGAS
jgi:hypothetical protein